MKIGDILTIAAAIIASLGGGAAIVLALSSWIGKIWANRLMEADKARFARDLKSLESQLSRAAEDRTRKLESLMRHYERQIEEFYGPLFNMVHQVFVTNHIQSEIVRQSKAESAEHARDYFHATYFGPLHDGIRQIVRTKLYLIEGSEMPASFYLYLKHAAQERDQRVLWKQYGVDSSFLKGEPWPDQFYDDIKAGFERAMKNYEACLDGLKAQEAPSHR
jgi:hypothetical protein